MPPPEDDGWPARVIHLAPRSGESGVGDYADDFVAALRRHTEVVELRHGPPGADGVADIRRLRRRLRELVAESPPGTVVHAEMSGGATPAFWSLRGLPARRTVTVHDAPRPVWFPTLTRGMQRSRLGPLLLRAMSSVWLGVERRAMREVGVVTLTEAGAELTRELGIGAEVRVGHLVVPERPAVPPPWERPAAVGMFGHVYHGKGFHLLERLRADLPDDIAIRVAGRGTEQLRPVRGVDILGPVEGDAEDDFFASIRVLLLPYRRRPIGRVRARAASATHLQGAAYDTPAVATRSPTMDELGAAGGCVMAEDAADLPQVAERLVRSEPALREAHARLVAYRDSLTLESALAPFRQLWSRS